MLTNNLKELINEVKEEKKRQAEEEKFGRESKAKTHQSSKKRKQLGSVAVNLFANVETNN